MEPEEEQHKEEQLDNNNNPLQPTMSPNAIDTPTNEESAIKQTEVTTPQPQEPVRIIIEQDKRNDKHSAIANVLSFLGLCLAGAALFYTYKLYDKTIEANKISQNSLTLAREQFQQSKKDNDSAKKEAEKAAAENNIKYRKQFSLDSQSLSAQINAFKASQQESELENRPFVQVYNIKIDTSGSIGNIKFTVFNYGKFPAKIEYVKYRIGIALTIKPDKRIYLKWENNERKIYIVSGLNSLPEIQFIKATSNDAIKAFKDGQIITYLEVEIKYTSYVTNKTFLHKSLNEMRYGNFVRSIINDDKELKR
jgi:hypothetical protein